MTRQGLRFCRMLQSGSISVASTRAAAEAANRAIRLVPRYPNTYRWLAAALGQLGRTAEAGEALEKAIAAAPAVFDMYVHQRRLGSGRKITRTYSRGCTKPGCRSNDCNPDYACGDVYRHARTLPVRAVEPWRKSRPLISTFPSSVN